MSSGHLHPQYNLRWPEELRDKIAASAKAHNRSMNADIVARLEKSLKDDEESLNAREEEALNTIKQANVSLERASGFIESLLARIENLESKIKIESKKPTE